MVRVLPSGDLLGVDVVGHGDGGVGVGVASGGLLPEHLGNNSVGLFSI